jgi:hypothetical protein
VLGLVPQDPKSGIANPDQITGDLIRQRAFVPSASTADSVTEGGTSIRNH